MTSTETIVWQGASYLRPLLVRIDSLEPWPDNPRKGDVDSVRESLRVLGQRKPIVVQGTTIVAGHHLVRAAAELDWTHVAAGDGEFEDEEHARKFLIADNRTSELGRTDDRLLAAQLDALRSYEGVGYTDTDREELAERLASLRQPTGPPQFGESEEVPSLDSRSPTTGLFEVPLLLDVESRRDFANLVGMLKREWSLDDTTAVVLRAVREAAQRT